MKAFAITVQETYTKDNILHILDDHINDIANRYHVSISEFIKNIPPNLKANTLMSLIDIITDECIDGGQKCSWDVQESTFMLPYAPNAHLSEERLIKKTNTLTEDILYDTAHLFTAAAAISASRTAEDREEYLNNMLKPETYKTVITHKF